MSNREDIESIMGGINARSKRVNKYCDTFTRSGNADIKHLQLMLDEIHAMTKYGESLSTWITWQALGGGIDNDT